MSFQLANIAACPAVDPAAIDARKLVANPHSLRNRLERCLWGICSAVLYRPSPNVAHKYRVFLLRLFGADIHWAARPYPKCRIWLPRNLKMDAYSCLANNVDCYNVAPVELAAFATVSQYSYLCSATHDINDPAFPLASHPIHIGYRAWVAARAYIGPGVSVHEGAVVGANACAYKDVPAWTVAGGNPARIIGKRSMAS